MTASASGGSAELARLLARAEIEDLVRRYGVGADRGDAALVLSCFTDDVVVELDDGALVLEGPEVRAFYERSLAGAPARAMSHLMGNVLVAVTGTTATAHTTAIAFLDLGESAVVVVRGLEYEDELRLDGDGWRISRRRHRARWQYRAASDDIAASASLASGERRRRFLDDE